MLSQDDLEEHFTDEAIETMEKMYELSDFESVEELALHILRQRQDDPELEEMIEDE